MSYGAWISDYERVEKGSKSTTGAKAPVELDGQDKHLCFCSKWNGKSMGRFDEKSGMVLFTL